MDWKARVVYWTIIAASAICGLVVMRVLGFGYAIMLELLEKPTDYGTPFLVIDLIVLVAIIASITTRDILVASRWPAILLRGLNRLSGKHGARSS